MKIEQKDVLLGMLFGGLAGLAVAVGGAIKDSPNEGFKLLTFLRSPIIGIVEGGAIQGLAKTHPGITFLATIGTERITVESYKLIRAQTPGKFSYGEWGVKKKIAVTNREYRSNSIGWTVKGTNYTRL